jgi:hypothetical protein
MISASFANIFAGLRVRRSYLIGDTAAVNPSSCSRQRHRHDFLLVVFQQWNNDFCLLRVCPREGLGTVPKGLLSEPFGIPTVLTRSALTHRYRLALMRECGLSRLGWFFPQAATSTVAPSPLRYTGPPCFSHCNLVRSLREIIGIAGRPLPGRRASVHRGGFKEARGSQMKLTRLEELAVLLADHTVQITKIRQKIKKLSADEAKVMQTKMRLAKLASAKYKA